MIELRNPTPQELQEALILGDVRLKGSVSYLECLTIPTGTRLVVQGSYCKVSTVSGDGTLELSDSIFEAETVSLDIIDAIHSSLYGKKLSASGAFAFRSSIEADSTKFDTAQLIKASLIVGELLVSDIDLDDKSVVSAPNFIQGNVHGKYPWHFDGETLRIACQARSLDKWRSMSDDEIAATDDNPKTVARWHKYGGDILNQCETYWRK